jgi:hypothetical protein
MLLNTGYKILTSIINDRIKNYTEDIIGEYQCGFRANRSTIDQLFVMRQIIEKNYEYGVDMHILFVDYKQAFDSINRKKMIQALEYFVIPPKLINLVKMTLDQTTAKVKIEQQIGDEFH